MASVGVTIYALCDPDGSVRYIGQTPDPARRLRLHLAALSGRAATSALYTWLRELRALGESPRLVELEVVRPVDAARAEARQITLHLAQGCRLTNRTAPRGALELGARVSADVGPRLYAMLTQRAQAQNCTVSWLLRSILEDYAARPAAQEVDVA